MSNITYPVDMDQCPNCGSSVREWKDTCDECGASLQGDTGGGWGSGGGSERQPREQQRSGGQNNRSWGGEQSTRGQQENRPQRGRGESGGPQRGRRESGRGRGREQDDGIDRRTLLAGGGVAAAALAGGWFVFLREGGDGENDNGGDDAGPTTTPESISPSQSQSEAPTITSGRYGPFTLDGTGDEHYFAVDLEAGDQLEVTMEFSHSEGDLDIELLNPTGTRVSGSASITDDETVSTTASVGGEHYIRAYPFISATNSYELDVRIS